MTHDEWLEHGPKINGMTNWQRNQWAKDGYKLTKIDHFLSLKRLGHDVSQKTV